MEKYYNELKNIEEQKIDIVKLFLLSTINMSQATKEEEWKIVNYCYDLWLKADVDLDLSRLADIVVEFWGKIQQDEMTDEEIIEMCLDI